MLSKTKVVNGETLVPLFESVVFLFGGRIPSLALSSVLSPGSLVSAAGDSIAETSVVAVGEAADTLLALVGACGSLLAVAVLCTGKKPVPLIGRDGLPVPVASAMLRVMVRVADEIVVVRVRVDKVSFDGDVEASS